MNRDKRFELITRADSERICGIAERILDDAATAVEAEVRIGSELGYAMVMGRDPEAALAGAILDAAVESGHPLAPEILDILRSEEVRRKEELQKTWAKVATTKVDFEVMM